jgi:hypothetical protein
MVDQVIANPSLGLLSPCEVVPLVLILVTKVQGVTHLNPIPVALQWVGVNTLNSPKLHLADS